MNPNILKKCINELTKEKPNIDYVRGMLETLYEMQTPEVVKTVIPKINLNATSQGTTDEASLMDAKAKAAIAEVKRLAEISTENNARTN